MISSEEYDQWYRYAKNGDWVTYHIGHHLFGLRGTKKDAAARAWDQSERGLVFICQRRVPGSGGMFEYRAMKVTDKVLQKKIVAWRFR